MGILNITPDSFSDGGQFMSPGIAVQRAREMVGQGAAIIDVGGESTRPGAPQVSIEEELARVIPVIEALRNDLTVPISIDTSKPEVMREAVRAGAGMINDVRALREKGALQTAVELDVPVCLMHMQGEPRTMQHSPHYGDVVAEVKSFLKDRIKTCIESGISRDRLLIDPGFGFGKSLEHNLRLLQGLNEFRDLNIPLLAGFSRKSMIGQILDVPVQERLYGSIALATLALWQGANLVRVHDVRATRDAIGIINAIRDFDTVC
ncbi:MAG TPA: dihydropteroate synthase [Gammaproteobacteria bacterium]